jgi:transposase InsO family protein
MQALSTRKENKDQVQIKQIFNYKNDYTRMTAVCFLKNKSEAFENFKIYKEMVENEMESRIKCLISDNGGEFTSKEFMDYCSRHGIKRKSSIVRTPQ